MPALETPPNPAPATPPPAPQKVPAGRFGELDHSELVHLLDTLDDDRARSRFRESIYISLLFYVVLGWFVLYGPRVLWHTPQVVPIAAHEEKHEMPTLETPSNLAKLLPKSHSAAPKPAAPAPKQQAMDEKTLRQLEAMRHQPAPRPTPPQPAPKPLPQAPQPQQQTQTPAPLVQRPQPPAPQPRPQPTQSAQAIPDAPKPSQTTRPNFGTPQSPGESIAQAAHDAATGRGGGATSDSPSGKPSINSTGYEILSDTQGVDFMPYIRRLLSLVRAGWIPLLPEETRPPLSKKGTTLIRFTIKADGTLSYMHLDDSTHDRALDEAAWGGIKSVGQYPPLPSAFKGPELDLRIQFLVNQDVRGSHAQ